jgi:hypothetical protein
MPPKKRRVSGAAAASRAIPFVNVVTQRILGEQIEMCIDIAANSNVPSDAIWCTAARMCSTRSIELKAKGEQT